MTEIVTLNIDGLDPEVLRNQLKKGNLPELSKILGEDFKQSVDLDVCSVAPSVTFAAQASIITGEHPSRTGMTGNKFYKRDQGISTVFGSDRLAHVGESLAIHGKALADRMLSQEVKTVFETLREQGVLGEIFHNIYGRGSREIRPSVIELARFYALKKDISRMGQLDDQMLLKLEQQLTKQRGNNSLIMAYFLGLDKASHQYGPNIQGKYLSEVIDRQVGRIIRQLKHQNKLEDTIFIVISDHSQTEISSEGDKRLQNISNWNKLLKSLGTQAFGPEKTKQPGTIIGLNGGFAHLYVKNFDAHSFQEAPSFTDTLKLAEHIFEANRSGKPVAELKGTLDLVLVRDSERSWKAQYKVYCGHNRPLMDLRTFFNLNPELDYLDPVNRLNNLSCANSGDIILLANWRDKHAFRSSDRYGSHGGLSRNQSRSTMVVAKPGADKLEIEQLNEKVRQLVDRRAFNDGQRMPSIVDYAAIVQSLAREYLAGESRQVSHADWYAGSAGLRPAF